MAMNWQRVNDQNLVRQRDEAWEPQESMGSKEVCWCGKSLHHEWPSQEDGTPHPKEEGSQ